MSAGSKRIGRPKKRKGQAYKKSICLICKLAIHDDIQYARCGNKNFCPYHKKCLDEWLIILNFNL